MAVPPGSFFFYSGPSPSRATSRCLEFRAQQSGFPASSGSRYFPVPLGRPWPRQAFQSRSPGFPFSVLSASPRALLLSSFPPSARISGGEPAFLPPRFVSDNEPPDVGTAPARGGIFVPFSAPNGSTQNDTMGLLWTDPPTTCTSRVVPPAASAKSGQASFRERG